MAFRDVLWILAHSVVLASCLRSKDECWRSKKFENVGKGHALIGHVISSLQVSDRIDCAFACLDEYRCHSYNFQEGSGSLHLCQLSNESRETKLDDYKVQADMTYYDAKMSNEGPTNKRCVGTCHRVAFSVRCGCDDFHEGDFCQDWSEKARDYDLKFPRKSVLDFVPGPILNLNLASFTVSLWFKSRMNEPFGILGGPVSIGCEETGSCNFSVNGDTRSFYGFPLNDYVWHHICVKWSSSDGDWTAYIDGATNALRSGRGLRPNQSVQLEGSPLVLGVAAENETGTFINSFKGSISQVNLWDYTLSKDEVVSLASSCPNSKGNVLDWADFRERSLGKVTTTEKSDCVRTDFSVFNVSFGFPAKNTSNYIRLSGTLPSLVSFTLCVWLKLPLDDVGFGGLFSYAHSSHSNGLLIGLKSDYTLRMYLNSSYRNLLSTPLTDNKWHHMAITWSSSEGKTAFYIDGALEGLLENFLTGETILGGGVVIIGQDQDEMGGGFAKTDAFWGFVTHINMWERILSPFALADMATAPGNEKGDLIAWSDIVASPRYGQVQMEYGVMNGIKRANSDFMFVFPSKSTENFVEAAPGILTGMEKITACLWVQTTGTTDVAFFSYTTSTYHDGIALTVAYDDVLHFIVNSVEMIGNLTGFQGSTDWQHICVMWNSKYTNWKGYRNGENVITESNNATGEVIEAGGKMVLGQYYVSVDVFSSLTSFEGKLSHVNIWNRTFGDYVISAMFRGCDAVGGNAVDWIMFAHGIIAGNVETKSSADCTIPDTLIVKARDNFCTQFSDPDCEDPIYALFDDRRAAKGKLWRCYYKTAVGQNSLGLIAYNASLKSTCYESRHNQLVDIIQRE